MKKGWWVSWFITGCVIGGIALGWGVGEFMEPATKRGFEKRFCVAAIKQGLLKECKP